MASVPKTGFSVAVDDASANFEFYLHTYLNQSIAKMHCINRSNALMTSNASANFEFYISESINCKNALFVLIGLDIRERPLMH